MPVDPELLAAMRRKGVAPTASVAISSGTTGGGSIDPELIQAMKAKGMNPGIASPFGRGFMGHEEQKGWNLPNVAEEIGQGFGPMVGGTVGGMLGPGGAAAGAALGKEGQMAIQEIAGTTDRTPFQMAYEPAIEAGLNYAGARYAPAVVKKVGTAATAVYDYAAENLGGIGKGTMQFARENLPTVSKYIGASKERIGSMAGDIRGALSGAVEASEQVYRDIVSELSKPRTQNIKPPASGLSKEYSLRGYGLADSIPAADDMAVHAGGEKRYFGPENKINLKEGLSSRLNEIEESFGFNAPPTSPKSEPAKAIEIFDQYGNTASRQVQQRPVNMIPEGSVKRIVSKQDVALFKEFKDLAGQLENATPKQVYFYQRDLNRAIRDHEGKDIAGALGELKTTVNDVIEKNADKLPELVKANKAWSYAQELAQETRGFMKSEDMIQYVKDAYSANKYDSSRRRMLEEVGKKVPAIGQIIGEARAAIAGEQLSPMYRGLPQTGAGTGIVTMGIAAAKAPPLIPAMMAGSPRTYYLGLRAADALGPITDNATKRVAPYMGHVAGQSLQDAYESMRFNRK